MAKQVGNRAAARKYGVDKKRVREWIKQEATFGLSLFISLHQVNLYKGIIIIF